MKKALILLCLLCLLAGLFACGSPPPGSEPASSPNLSAAAQLSEIFHQIRQNVSIATAGSSLRAAAAAATLLDWAEGAVISDRQMEEALAPWLEAQDDGMSVDFLEQLAAVDNMVSLLTREPGSQVESLLSDAGCADCGYPWSPEAAAVAERLMTLAGLRDAEGGN